MWAGLGRPGWAGQGKAREKSPGGGVRTGRGWDRVGGGVWAGGGRAMGTGICQGNGGRRLSGGRGMLERPRWLEAHGGCHDRHTYILARGSARVLREGLVVVRTCRPRALEGGVEHVAAVE